MQFYHTTQCQRCHNAVQSLPSSWYSKNWDSSAKCTFSQSSQRAAVRSRPCCGNKRTVELPWDTFWQFVWKYFGCRNQLLHQLSRWMLQTILQVKKPIVDLGLVCGCGASYGGEIKILLTGNITGGLSCSQHANYMFLKMQHPWHCGCVQTANLNLFFGISTLSWFLQFRRSCCSNPISKCLLHHLECDSQ